MDWMVFIKVFISILAFWFAIFSVGFLWMWVGNEFGPGWGLTALVVSGAFWIALAAATI